MSGAQVRNTSYLYVLALADDTIEPGGCLPNETVPRADEVKAQGSSDRS